MLGLLFIILGLLGRAWCSLYIGGRKSRQLVIIGPYSISRNPLYLFSLVATAGLGAQTGSILIALLSLLGAWFVFWPVIRHEEEILAKLFPEDYPDYRSQVPRLIPDIRRWADVGYLYVIRAFTGGRCWIASVGWFWCPRYASSACFTKADFYPFGLCCPECRVREVE